MVISECFADTAPVLADELLEYLGNVFQEERSIRDRVFFDDFVRDHATHLGGARPVEYLGPDGGGWFLRPLPKQRFVAARLR